MEYFWAILEFLGFFSLISKNAKRNSRIEIFIFDVKVYVWKTTTFYLPLSLSKQKIRTTNPVRMTFSPAFNYTFFVWFFLRIKKMVEMLKIHTTILSFVAWARLLSGSKNPSTSSLIILERLLFLAIFRPIYRVGHLE